MAITIQELLASDTISQVVDKINFNFDQLLLNGGGPVGPAGASGPTGPIGGRGERGTEWYEGTDDPNVTAPTPTPLKADYYLQSNGDVWEYTGLTWNNTGINLKGPTGSTGASAGWSFFGNDGSGNYFATAKNTSYPSLMPSSSQTINQTNEGVTTSAFGIAGPNDSGYPGIPLTAAFQLTSAMAGSLDSSTVTMLVHQKNSAASAIKFMGGGAIANDNYEQNTLANLSSIKLGVDDSLVIDVPKTITGTIGSVSDTYGFNVYTANKAQNYRSGRSIDFKTGTLGNVLSGAYDVSDFSIQINPVNPTIPPKFSVQVLGTNNASFELGGNITFPTTTPSAGGRVLIDGSELRLRGSGTIRFNSATTDYKFVNLNAATGTAVGIVGYTSTGSLTSLAAGGSLPTGILGWSGTALTGDTGVNERLVRWDGVRNIESSNWGITDTGILTPYGSQKWIGSTTTGVERINLQKDSNNDAHIVLNNVADVAATQDRLLIYTENVNGGKAGLAISDKCVFIGDADPTGFIIAGSNEVLRLQSKGSSDSTKLAPQVFIELGGNSTSEPPGIFARPAGSNLPSTYDRLTIQGGRGYSLASTTNLSGLGRDVQIAGGESSNNQRGGNVYIGGGESFTGGSDAGGSVYLGYNLNASNKYSQNVIIGNPNAGNNAYFGINQPPSSALDFSADDIIMTIESNRNTADSKGRIQFANSDNSKAIEFIAQAGVNNYNPIVESEDNVIFSRGTTGGAGTNGLVIGIKDKDVGIRMDAGDAKMSIYAEANNTPSTINSDFTFYVEGNVHIDHTNQYSLSNTISTVGNPQHSRAIFASGTFGPQNATSGSRTVSGTWVRVGRCVTFTGTAVASGSTAGERRWPLPLVTSSGTQNLVGSGTIFTNNNGSVGNEHRAVVAFPRGTNSFGFKWGGDVWVGNPYSGTSTTGGAGTRFTIMYELK